MKRVVSRLSYKAYLYGRIKLLEGADQSGKCQTEMGHTKINYKINDELLSFLSDVHTIQL